MTRAGDSTAAGKFRGIENTIGPAIGFGLIGALASVARWTRYAGKAKRGGLQLPNESWLQILKVDIVACPIFPTKFLHSFWAAFRGLSETRA